MQRWVCLLVGATVMTVAIAGASGVSAIAPGVGSALLAAPLLQETDGLPAGISLEMLGSQETTAFWLDNAGVELLLERVPLDPGDALDSRDPDESGGGGGTYIAGAQGFGAHLLYVESGELILATIDGEATYRQGESAFMPAASREELDAWRGPGSYDLRNDSGTCASILRVSVHFLGRPTGGIPSAPSGPERGCGSYELLFFDRTSYPWPLPPPDELPVQMFLGRLNWTEDAWLSRLAYGGPVGFAVESGRLSAYVGGRGSQFTAEIPRSGQFSINSGVTFSGWATDGTSALVMGVVPAGAEWSVIPPLSGTDANSMSTVFPPGAFVVTTDERVRLRAAPSTNGVIVAELALGAVLIVEDLPEQGDGLYWYSVFDSEGRTGYVASTFLSYPVS